MIPPLDQVLEAILDLARWAPSGDNTQPWRFEIVDARHIVLHGFDTRAHCVYDLDGHPSQMALGALIESLVIGASVHKLEVQVLRRTHLPETTPTFDIAFVAAALALPDPLASCLRARSVQRRALQTRAISAQEKARLEAALPPGFQVLWLEGFARRLAAARLMFNNAHLRLTMPEAHRVHSAVIEWGARFSEDRIPDQALGVDRMTARLMRWVMASWDRVAFFNTYLAGTLAPRLQMDLLPGLACGAHFVLLAKRRAGSVDEYVAAGRAMQRFWLTATELQLQVQPEMTPLIFRRYVREGRSFSASPGMHGQAAQLARQAEALLGTAECERAVFMGRIGAGKPATARSTRRPLKDLILPG